jgi:uncharacterized membrane protein
MSTIEEQNQWHNDSKNWKLGLFYFNKNDERVFVEKRITWTGITLNFANPKSYLVVAVAIWFFGFILSRIN